MTVLHAALLGIVQGITEFLPVSSSAHLILARSFFGWDAGKLGLTFDVGCHLGTLLAILAYFHRDVGAIIAAIPEVVRGADTRATNLARNLAVATVPLLIIGLLLPRPLVTSFRTVGVAVVALALGGFIMLIAEWRGTGDRTQVSLTTREAFGLGFAQAVALIPGVSRSGAVLTMAMFLGFKREEAARFSFLLGVPAIIAAAGSEAMDVTVEGLPADALGLLVLGFVSSALVGYFAVKYFIHYVARYSLHPFAAYRLGVAAASFGWMLRA